MPDVPLSLRPKVSQLCTELTLEFAEISPGRLAALQELADFVLRRRTHGAACRITAICTHNSRRSHFAQLWLAIAADYYGIPEIETFSGGTAATALEPRAVQALKRAGLKVEGKTARDDNPLYHVRWREQGPPYAAFSKVYDDPPNPKRDFAAVLVCTAAAADCPFVNGAELRVQIPYDDPKRADGTAEEEEVYDESLREIGREMLYVMARVADSLR